ncbi:MAG: hypothetical protein IMZ70_00425 [Candidatus Atribacteria bacterium]|nr:hypothetical protein [Candidatus Atribacteria bacterium]MBE3139012.1 hypothetical protein [Thermoplasmata archaeon]
MLKKLKQIRNFAFGWLRPLERLVSTQYIEVPIKNARQYRRLFDKAKAVGYTFGAGCGVHWCDGSLGYLDKKIIFDRKTKKMWRDRFEKDNQTTLSIREALKAIAC